VRHRYDTSFFLDIDGAVLFMKQQATRQNTMLKTKYTKVSANIGIVFTCFFICFVNATNSVAKQSSAHAQLASKVEAHLFEQINPAPSDNLKVLVRDIDERIDIPYCPQPYEFSSNNLQQNQSNVSVKVVCPSSQWYLFTHATVAQIQEVVVASDNLSPGSLLNKSNLQIVEMDKNKLRGFTFSSMEEIIGARIKRRTRAGNIISDRMLCFICKGDRVTISAVSGSLSIQVYGVAEEDGVLGETIQVRNISSDKLIYAKVASTSEVHIHI